jgi:glycosyltransferase involved in cell wall biosynthesis
MERDLSVIIPARNEEFLARTVEDVLVKKRGNTEVIVILDGSWANPPVIDHPDITIIYHSQSIGQRASVNEGVKLSKAKFIMKLDAHCIVDEGFDVKLMADCEYDWTVIPRMYNLHAFDWQCNKCKERWYQGPTPKKCPKCDNTTGFERIMVWQPRWHKRSDFMRFDSDLHFQYWGALGERPESKEDIADNMSFIGACWFMHRQRYWDIDGLDEAHGSWGQVGTEISCKTWLSGGRLVVNKKTWFTHLFRTQGGDFGFPYPQSGNQVSRARKYSKELFIEGKWKKAKHPLNWLLKKFWPIPGWKEIPGEPTKGIIYYTDNQLNMKIAHRCRQQILKSGLPIVSVSLKPMNFGKNIVLKLKRSYEAYFKQILTALENSTADVIYFAEHDWLYSPEHFRFTPPKKDVYYYNDNWWRLRLSDGHAITYDTHVVPSICGYRELLLNHYRKAVEVLEKNNWDNNLVRAIGFEPGTTHRDEKVDDYKAEGWRSDYPNIDIRHDNNLTRSKWKQSDFRNQRSCRGWRETDDEIIPWGKNQDIIKRLKRS